MKRKRDLAEKYRVSVEILLTLINLLPDYLDARDKCAGTSSYVSAIKDMMSRNLVKDEYREVIGRVVDDLEASLEVRRKEFEEETTKWSDAFNNLYGLEEGTSFDALLSWLEKK